MNEMRAAVIRGTALEIEERTDPEPKPGQLLIRNRAAGINNADLHQLAATTRRRRARRPTCRGSSARAKRTAAA
jgi:Zn-dependent alcohol dehydrogenases